ncbi:hypothetical protein KAR91_86800 [Candidatus Pacearchaeota archaeon]|nr:hypothetical protein [Candidatus Pacearchaeota archaeon]
MNSLKTLLGLLIMIGGVLGSIYLGFWVCIIGGIWSIIQMLTGAIVGSMGAVAWAFVKIVCGGTIGAILGWLSVFIGTAIMEA